jgi:hypothetical protein
MPTPTPSQLRQMLAIVKAELQVEKDAVRAHDLRMLRLRLEAAIKVAALADSRSRASAHAPPGVTIH